MRLRTFTAHDGAQLVPLFDGEMADLLRQSKGRTVSARFGVGGSALVAAEARWALALLAQWRGIAFRDGAGI